jgi:hypothetical protein
MSAANNVFPVVPLFSNKYNVCKKSKKFWLTEMNSHGSKTKNSVSGSTSVSNSFFFLFGCGSSALGGMRLFLQ